MSSELKAGDRVIRITGMNADMQPKDKGTVLEVSHHSDGDYLIIKEFRGFMLHEARCFKKIIRIDQG